MHFERMASEYDTARPPYPPMVFETLASRGVIGEGAQVVEVGAGSGLATRPLVSAGCRVTAVEPGAQLAELLREALPEVEIVPDRLEDAVLAEGAYDAALAATSMHWVDLEIGLPVLHRALRPGGWLASWRHVFGDPEVRTPFRERVQEIVAARAGGPGETSRDERPTVNELSNTGFFTPVDSWQWQWSINLDADHVRRLFGTFSDWTESEVAAAADAVDELGGVVTEHYRCVLHVLRRT